MIEIPKKVIDGVAIINAQTGISLTKEQAEVAYRFNDSMAVFANPGTGKTTTAVTGLIAAQVLHGIPGKKINAMSFTKLATAELSARYTNACKKCNLVPSVRFNTFHSICYRIIRNVYPDFSIRYTSSIEGELKDFKEFLKSEGVEKHDDMFFVKEVYKAMNSLNNELLFSKSSVEASAKFINISDNITIKQFQTVRARWFKRNFIAQSITQGDIPTMVLFILLIHPELKDALKREYELMIVDEFQDMSVLYLEILSMISNKLIVIGDLKQQIYGFNGASPLILDAYKEMYPNAPSLELTQSFRCRDNIVNIANDIIAPNEIEGYLNFKGIGDGGYVEIVENSTHIFDNIVKELKEKQDNNEYLDIMFLARNNASVVPIIEKLYTEGVVFRTTKLMKVMDIPIFKDLCIMADVALNSKNPEYVSRINRFFPEFRWLPASQNPILEVMRISPRETDKDLLTMNYSFNDKSSYVIINKLRRFVELNNTEIPFSVSCKPLLEIYEEFVIEGKWWKLEQNKDYYFNLVEPIITNKSYNEMVYDENDKANKNEYYCSLNEGVRCYTFHSSKGLEADKVYLLDVDDMILPKDESISKLVNQGCSLEAARELRNERNLLYVAVTRCKSMLTIVHNGELSTLIGNPDSNGYCFLDDVWKEKAVLSNETKAFKVLMGVNR